MKTLALPIFLLVLTFHCAAAQIPKLPRGGYGGPIGGNYTRCYDILSPSITNSRVSIGTTTASIVVTWSDVDVESYVLYHKGFQRNKLLSRWITD
jgi:hypothetical protein